METVLQHVEAQSIENFELIFIPVLYQRHYYLMVFNLKNAIVEIIDNSAAEASISEKYAGWVEKMVRL